MEEKEIKILYLYPDMLELYGDYGNIQVLKYRMEKRNIKCKIDRYSIGDAKPNFCEYDIVFAGGGADNEQSILAEDLVKYSEEIKLAVQKGVFFLLICGAYQLFGKYYKGVEGNIIPGLDVFPYYTEAVEDRKKRCIGNIILEVELIKGKPTKVIGFENHGGQTYQSTSTFGKVLFGNGNQFGADREGLQQWSVAYLCKDCAFGKGKGDENIIPLLQWAVAFAAVTGENRKYKFTGGWWRNGTA